MRGFLVWLVLFFGVGCVYMYTVQHEAIFTIGAVVLIGWWVVLKGHHTRIKNKLTGKT
jgi:hypothetical protein